MLRVDIFSIRRHSNCMGVLGMGELTGMGKWGGVERYSIQKIETEIKKKRKIKN